MKRTRSLRIAGVLVGLSLLAAACGDDDDAADSGDTGGDVAEYSIAFVGPLTGPDANLGIYIRDGAKTAVSEFNAEHDDIEITLETFDTQGDPAQAPGQFDKYVADEKILGIVGPAFSGETDAVLDSLEQEQFVMVSASATRVNLIDKGTSVFHRVLPDDRAQAAGIIEYLQAKIEPKSIAIIHDQTPYGQGLAADQLATQMPDSIDVVLQDSFAKGTTDLGSVVGKIKAAAPDALFFGGYYEDAGRLKKALADAEVGATFVSGDGALDAGFVTAAGAAAEGAILSCPCYFATEDAPGAIGEFAKAYEATIGNVPGTYSTEAFDAANILMTGITEGNTDRASLLEYVEGLKVVDEAISKPVEFEENGNIKAQGIYVFTVKDGKIVLDTATDDL